MSDPVPADAVSPPGDPSAGIGKNEADDAVTVKELMNFGEDEAGVTDVGPSSQNPVAVDADVVVADADVVVADADAVVADADPPVVADADPVVADADPVVADADPPAADADPPAADAPAADADVAAVDADPAAAADAARSPPDAGPGPDAGADSTFFDLQTQLDSMESMLVTMKGGETSSPDVAPPDVAPGQPPVVVGNPIGIVAGSGEPKEEGGAKQEPEEGDEPKQEEPKEGEPKQEEPKQEEPKEGEPKEGEQPQEEPNQEEPKEGEQPKEGDEEPKQEEEQAPALPEDPAVVSSSEPGAPEDASGEQQDVEAAPAPAEQETPAETAGDEEAAAARRPNRHGFHREKTPIVFGETEMPPPAASPQQPPPSPPSPEANQLLDQLQTDVDTLRSRLQTDVNSLKTRLDDVAVEGFATRLRALGASAKSDVEDLSKKIDEVRSSSKSNFENLQTKLDGRLEGLANANDLEKTKLDVLNETRQIFEEKNDNLTESLNTTIGAMLNAVANKMAKDQNELEEKLAKIQMGYADMQYTLDRREREGYWREFRLMHPRLGPVGVPGAMGMREGTALNAGTNGGAEISESKKSVPLGLDAREGLTAADRWPTAISAFASAGTFLEGGLSPAGQEAMAAELSTRDDEASANARFLEELRLSGKLERGDLENAIAARAKVSRHLFLQGGVAF